MLIQFFKLLCKLIAALVVGMLWVLFHPNRSTRTEWISAFTFFSVAAVLVTITWAGVWLSFHLIPDPVFRYIVSFLIGFYVLICEPVMALSGWSSKNNT